MVDPDPIIEKVMNSGHLSVLEHMSFSFAIEGVSRSLLAQLTRHRIASFSVESQRYVSQAGFGYVVPPAIKELGELYERTYAEQMTQISQWYMTWVTLLGNNEKGREDARYVLPNACTTKLVLTMNARELLHFFNLRCCNRAQWEIRALADEMLRQCRDILPQVFEKAGAPCTYGACPEGEKTCGHPRRSENIVEEAHS